jgi:cyanosortase A-associated protein
LYSSAGESHLSTCLVPGGVATVTREQFVQTRYGLDLRFPRLFFWLGGTIPLFNNQCLWVKMSMPAPPTAAVNWAPLEVAAQKWLWWWQNYLVRLPSFS